MGFIKNFKNVLNVFYDKNNRVQNRLDDSNFYEYGTYYRPDRVRLITNTDRSIVNSIFNRISMDVAAIEFSHCKVDNEERFVSYINSNLNNCLTLEANIDQTARSFIQDAVITMLDNGCVALVPVDTIGNSFNISSDSILTLRAGKIIEWYPNKVKIELYNDRNGRKENVILEKNNVAIIESPLYSVINEPNSTLQRLIRKLRLLDNVDEQSSSGKLDLIIQLPYLVKSEARKQQANERRSEIERQLTGSKYGIAYTDGTEKITQLNRPIENNLMKQIEYLTSMLYGQLGITQTVFDGTADEKIMRNYYSRTIEPIASAISDELKRKFLTKTARSQHQTILYFRDPFKLVPVNQLADIADKFTRNEILTSNEIRQIIGRKPSTDPKADQLLNSNINHSPNELINTKNQNGEMEIINDADLEKEISNMSIEEIEAEIRKLEQEENNYE